jgi:hypothetical protein
MKVKQAVKLLLKCNQEAELRVDADGFSSPLARILAREDSVILGDKVVHREEEYGYSEVK